MLTSCLFYSLSELKFVIFMVETSNWGTAITLQKEHILMFTLKARSVKQFGKAVS